MKNCRNIRIVTRGSFRIQTYFKFERNGFETFQLNRRFYRVAHASETNRDCVICVVQKMTNRCLCARLLMSPCVSKICC